MLIHLCFVVMCETWSSDADPFVLVVRTGLSMIEARFGMQYACFASYYRLALPAVSEPVHAAVAWAL